MDAPYFESFINQEMALETDPTVKRLRLANFFKRYLFQKALSVFKWTLPTLWRKEYFLYCLYGRGYLAIINTDKFGPIPQECGLYGYDVMYCPTHAIIANPLLKGEQSILQPKIDVQCVLLKMQPDYGSVVDLVNFYGNKLVLASESLDMNLLNSRLSYVFTARNKSKAETFKALHQKILQGEPSVVQDASLINADGTPAWQAFEQDVGSNYIADRLLADMRKIENMFCTAVGIPNANTEKRERQITDEVNANNVETASLASTWLENLKEGCEKAQKMFGITLDVEWRFPPMEEGGQKNEGNNNNLGTVSV